MCCIYACVDSPFPSSIPPFPFKDGIGEYSAADMLCNIYTSVKQHVKASLRDYTAYFSTLLLHPFLKARLYLKWHAP